MPQNFGDLSLNLNLNIEPLKAQLQVALSFLKNIQTAKIGDLGADSSGINKIIAGLEKTIPELDKAEKEVKESVEDIVKNINDKMKDRPIEIPSTVVFDWDKFNKDRKDEGFGLQSFQMNEEEKRSKELERQKKLVDDQKKEYREIESILSGFTGIFQAIGAKMGEAGKSFMQWVQGALAVLKQVLDLTNKQQSDEGIGFGDILGLLGTILPFFLASGGPARGNQPYIVGERGPELFVPNTDGTVVPNHMLGMFLAELNNSTQWGSRFRAAGGAVKAMSYPAQSMVVIPDVRVTGENLDLVFRRYNKAQGFRK